MKRNIYAGCDNAVLMKSSPIESVRVSSLGKDSTGEDLFKRESDIFLLFSQERLIERLGTESLRTWIDSLQGSSSAIDYSKFKDDQLLRFVKSRYVQEPSDIARWSSYLNDTASDLRRSFDDFARSLQVDKNDNLSTE